MFGALKRGDYATAEAIWAAVEPIEDLRDAIGPIPVLHAALTLADIAEMGAVRAARAVIVLLEDLTDAPVETLAATAPGGIPATLTTQIRFR